MTRCPLPLTLLTCLAGCAPGNLKGAWEGTAIADAGTPFAQAFPAGLPLQFDVTEYHPARETSLFTLPEEYVGTGSGEVPEGYPSDFDLDVWVEGDGSFTFDFDASADGLETTWGMSMFMVPEEDGLRGTFNAEVHTATLDSGYNTWDEGAISLTRGTP